MILYLTSMRMCGINFKIFGHANCKISALIVKKISFFANFRTRLFGFEPSQLNFFAL